MYPSDLKKLITGFLILSALSGTLTLVFLNSGDKSAPPPFSDSANTQTENPLAVGKNAFVEQLPQNSFSSANSQATTNQNLIQANGQPMGSANSPQIDTSNLTQNFANIFAQQTIAHNPDGPQTDANGKPTGLNLPDENSAATLIQQAITSSTFAVDEKIPDSDIKILATYTTNDAENYFKSVTSALTGIASSTQRINAVNQSSTPEEIIPVSQLVFETAFEKLKSIGVPRPLADFHRSMLQFFANQKKVFDIAGDYQTDPLKSMLVLQNEQEIVGRDLKNVQNEFQKLKSGTLSYDFPKTEDTKLSILDELLGVKKTYAAFTIVEDIVQIAQDLWKDITDIAYQVQDVAGKVANWAYTTALRIAVKILIDTFQNQVVNWIAGNGSPKFITDWKGFLSDVADKAAGQAISNMYPFLCSNIGPLIRIAVIPVPNLDTSVRCTLSQVVGNLTDFYNSFQNGGWAAYGAALQPQNNFFGGLIIVNDNVMRAAAAAANAAQNQAVASQGFLSVRKCAKSHTENFDTEGQPIAPQTVCDQYVDTTPGGAVAMSLNQALGWKGNEIISAKRFEELVAAIIDAGINRMMKEGLSALTAASNPAPTDFKNAIPPGVTDPGDISTLKSSTKTLIGAYQRNGAFQKFQDVSDADSQWLALLPAVNDTLTQVGSSCPSLTSSARQNIANLNSMKSNVTAEFLTASANTYGAFQTKIDNATSADVLAAMPDQLQNLANIPVDPVVAKNRLTSLQNLNANAQMDLQFIPQADPKAPPQRRCDVPLVDISAATLPPPPPSGG